MLVAYLDRAQICALDKEPMFLTPLQYVVEVAPPKFIPEEEGQEIA